MPAIHNNDPIYQHPLPPNQSPGKKFLSNLNEKIGELKNKVFSYFGKSTPTRKTSGNDLANFRNQNIQDLYDEADRDYQGPVDSHNSRTQDIAFSVLQPSPKPPLYNKPLPTPPPRAPSLAIPHAADALNALVDTTLQELGSVAAIPQKSDLTLPQAQEKFEKIFIILEKEVYGKKFFRRKKIDPENYRADVMLEVANRCNSKEGQDKFIADAKKYPDLFLHNPDIFLRATNTDTFDLRKFTATLSTLTNASLTESDVYANAELMSIYSNGAALGLLDRIAEEQSKTTDKSLPLGKIVSQFSNVADQQQRFNALADELKNETRQIFITDVIFSSHLTAHESDMLQRLWINAAIPEKGLEKALNLPDLNITALRTLVKMGEIIDNPDHGTVHSPKKRGEFGTLFFTVTKDNKCFITLDNSYLAAGTSKKVNEVLCLNIPDKKFVRTKIDKAKLATSYGKNAAKGMSEEVRNEVELLKVANQGLIAKNQKSYLLPDFEEIDFSDPRIDVGYVEKFNSDGTELLYAPLKHKISAFYGIAMGLNQLHQSGQGHFDFKPANFLMGPVVENEPLEVRVHDFGFSVPLDGKSLAREGTFLFAPPEARGEFIGTDAVDKWALGAVIATSMSPFIANYLLERRKGIITTTQLLDKIDEQVAYGGRPSSPEERKAVDAIRAIIPKLMDDNPDKRMDTLMASAILKAANNLVWLPQGMSAETAKRNLEFYDQYLT